MSDIDIQKESPCGHGVVICFSVYCGREAHFGELVDGQPADGILQNQLWVDTLVDEHKDQVLHNPPIGIWPVKILYWAAEKRSSRIQGVPGVWRLLFMQALLVSHLFDGWEGMMGLIQKA